jgi:hypothetical protein
MQIFPELSSGIYCRVKWLSTDVSEVRTASIIPLKRRSTIFYTAVHHRRQFWTSYSPPWELEISYRYFINSWFLNPDWKRLIHTGIHRDFTCILSKFWIMNAQSWNKKYRMIPRPALRKVNASIVHISVATDCRRYRNISIFKVYWLERTTYHYKNKHANFNQVYILPKFVLKYMNMRFETSFLSSLWFNYLSKTVYWKKSVYSEGVAFVLQTDP